MHAIKQLFGL